jgi:hypothetical protein
MTGPKPFVIGRTEWLKARGGRGPGLSGRSGRTARMAANVRAVPQVVFKVVKTGGCHGPNGLAAQMAYVLGKADHIIDPTKRFDGLDHLPKDYTRALAEDWAEGWNRKIASGNSLHMIASFPRGSDPEAVAEIIRATCHDLLDQGRSRFSYVAAIHADKDHPHAHILVDRRNADNELFFFARDHEFTYDLFKDRIVDHAAAHGIELVNSSRLSRGLADRAEPHARQAQRGLAGTLVAFGEAPYQNKPQERPSYFVTVKTPAGEKTLWGKELRGALEAADPPIGAPVRITHEGKETVSVTAKDGQRIDTHRNRWAVEVAGRDRAGAAPAPDGAPGAPTRPPSDAEARTAAWKHQQIMAHAEDYRTLGESLGRLYPALAQGFALAAQALERGRALVGRFTDAATGDEIMPDDQQMKDESDRLARHIEQARDDLMAVRDRIDDLPPAERPEIEAKYFDALRDVQEIERGYADRALIEPATGTIYAQELREQLQAFDGPTLAKALEGTGIDPVEMAARLAVQSDNAALESHWVEADAQAIAAERGHDMGTEEGRRQAFRDVVEVYGSLQQRALGQERDDGGRTSDADASLTGASRRDPARPADQAGIVADDNRELVGAVEDRQALIAEAQDLARRDVLTGAQQQRLTEIVDQTLGREAAQELKAGNTDVLRDFGDREDRIDLAERYLKAEQSQGRDRSAALDAVGKERELSAMDRQADRAQDLDRQDAQLRQRVREDGLER